MTPRRIVSNVKNYMDMDGETILERRLNSLLAVNFISSKNLYSDECLEYAIKIIEIRATPSPEQDVSSYLEEVFSMKPSQSLLDKIDKVFAKWQTIKQTSPTFQ